MEIIPAIDIIEGKCVRLTHGDFARQKTYHALPLDVAKAFEDAGIRRLHLVDLDGAKAGSIVNYAVLEAIASQTKMEIDFGGGIKKKEDVELVLKAGATMATIGSIAVKSPETIKEWLAEFGADRFFIGADVLDENIRINGWLADGGINVYTFLEQMISFGARHFFCTDISKDGAMQGPSTDLYKNIIARFPGINLTASGGVTTMNDLHELEVAGCAGAIIGKAIYEGNLSLEEITYFKNLKN
ncbi:MAG: hisA [Ferruginibacter sp.]|nr:hisA [Ferruginibacter sp.]